MRDDDSTSRAPRENANANARYYLGAEGLDRRPELDELGTGGGHSAQLSIKPDRTGERLDRQASRRRRALISSGAKKKRKQKQQQAAHTTTRSNKPRRVRTTADRNRAVSRANQLSLRTSSTKWRSAKRLNWSLVWSFARSVVATLRRRDLAAAALALALAALMPLGRCSLGRVSVVMVLERFGIAVAATAMPEVARRGAGHELAARAFSPSSAPARRGEPSSGDERERERERSFVARVVVSSAFVHLRREPLRRRMMMGLLRRRRRGLGGGLGGVAVRHRRE